MKKLFFKLFKKNPANMEMVRYWKTNEAVEAKVIKNKEGAIVMQMNGEKYLFPGFPRGYLLFGKLSKLKHEIKNQIFNDSWAKLEQGISEEEAAKDIKEKVLPKIFTLLEDSRYDMLPYEKMVLAVKEIYRAWPAGEMSYKLRDALTYIIQEDDSYRFRLQWLVTYFNPNKWWMKLLGKDIIKQFEKALIMLEHAEIIGDMKERIRLLRRILLAVLKDKEIKEKCLTLFRNIDWNKVKMSKADKYFFRGKYFKVDYDKFEY